uniref:Uncharacterized protein n=1 Tax=viral metagenome TaxID=1070528 RepID=A0A6C0F1H4_9ZZZZ
MCYSVESSAKTSLYSLVAIVVLMCSNIPHFKWIAMIMIGWCGMQFAELLLWLTNPRKSCTTANKIITFTLVPLVLILQPLAATLGSLFVKPWAKCSNNRKLFIVIFSIISSFSLLLHFYGKPVKYCTTVTPDGHLNWWISKYVGTKPIAYTLWLIIIAIPIFVLWDMSYKIIVALSIMPAFGFYYGLTTDSKGSIWCYYTSFTALVSLFAYALYKFKIYNILK